jgi:predicted acylesterase/phospholipase RssA
MANDVDAEQFLDEFRPFRRGELVLARKLREEPLFLSPPDVDVLRHALRVAQLSSLDGERDALVAPIGSTRLRLLQLLAPALPTDPRRVDAAVLHELIPRVAALVEEARRSIFEAGLSDPEALDAELAHKRVALVLGGAGGCGYVYVGVLQRLEAMGITPSYLVGCSIGAILAVARARHRHFDLDEIADDVRRLNANAVFKVPRPFTRHGLPAALRLDLRPALGSFFELPDGGECRLRDLEIPVDILATGVGLGALSRPREEYAGLVGADLRGAGSLRGLRGSALGRAVSATVSLAMSRRVLAPVLFGADSETALLPALDAAGFSAAIPALLHYELQQEDAASRRIVDAVFRRDDLVALVDGGIASNLPARYAWDAIEAGRIGSRHSLIVGLDGMESQRGANAPFAPLQRVARATAHRDGPFWDLRVPFKRAPAILELFPRDATLRRAARTGEQEFQATSLLLRELLAPLAPWERVKARIEGRA